MNGCPAPAARCLHWSTLSPPRHEALNVNKDQVKGTAKDIGGKVQQKVGEAVGSRQQQSEGLSNQAEGKVQEKYGDVKDSVNKDSIDRGNR